MKEDLSITTERMDDFVVLLSNRWTCQYLAGTHRLERGSSQIDGAVLGAASTRHSKFCAPEWSDVQEIYRLRRNILDRLVRNANQRRWRLRHEEHA